MVDNQEFITFVLGAGASFEVDMPTGNELKGKIASSLSFRVENYNVLVGGDNKLREALSALALRRGNSSSLQDYYNAARRISTGMLQAPSVDNFIDSNRSNGLIEELGKLAIASEILKAERQSKLYINPKNIHNKLDFSRVSDTWFDAFFQLISLNAQEEDLPSRFSRVRVVTFNYDRTLEHFLFNSIQNYYGSSPDRAAEILSNLTVLHPYGQVGNLPWQKSEMAVPFGSDEQLPTLVKIAQTLRTFTEGTSELESQIEHIRASIFEAEILTFLGFAYHDLNLQLLFGSWKDIPVRNSKRVFGTAMGLSESNKKAIIEELAHLGRFDSSQITLRRELSAAQLLPEYSRSLRVPGAANPMLD